MLFAIASLPANVWRLAGARKGNGSPILVIPGFATTDNSTLVLRGYLSWLGYRVYGWGLGRNLGAKTIGLHNELLIARLDDINRAEGQKVILIGWSMGGIMARMISRVRPHKVRQIVTLGAPFSGNPFANSAWRLYEQMSGHSLSHPIAQAQIAESKLPPPVPSVSLFSKSDGVVAWQSCLEPKHDHSKNIEVKSAHCGFGFAAPVLRVIADTLASPDRLEVAS
jgi:pimeloyl-ACP methyl ester carboxylesterase